MGYTSRVHRGEGTQTKQKKEVSSIRDITAKKE